MIYASPRLPLQTGATMLKRIVWATAIVAAFWTAFPIGLANPVNCVVWIYFIPLVALILMAILGRTRASGCVFEPDELRIEGGRYDGFRMAWTAIDAEGSRLSCGAPATFDDRDVVRCRACGHDVPIADAIRLRVHASRDQNRHRANVDALVQQLLNQPTATRVNRTLALLAAIGLCWLPLPAMVHAWWAMGATTAVASTLCFFGYAIITDRRAIRILTLDFAARSARAPGAVVAAAAIAGLR